MQEVLVNLHIPDAGIIVAYIPDPRNIAAIPDVWIIKADVPDTRTL
jgi:hypothetical protein